MSKPQTIEKIDRSLIVSLDPDGNLNLAACLQCGRCSSGCTMRQEADLFPHQLNRMAALGMEKELLASKAIWTCISCQTCVSRCPMKVDTPAMIDKLRTMSKSAPDKELERIRIFNESLLSVVKIFGRNYEFGMMGIYKLKTGDFFSDMDKLPTMLRKGKMSILPSIAKGRKSVADLFSKARKPGRTSR